MNRTIKPWVKTSVKILATSLYILFAILVTLYVLALDKRVSSLESRPVALEKVEVVVTPEPTASPSAKAVKIVPTVAQVEK